MNDEGFEIRIHNIKSELDGVNFSFQCKSPNDVIRSINDAIALLEDLKKDVPEEFYCKECNEEFTTPNTGRNSGQETCPNCGSHQIKRYLK